MALSATDSMPESGFLSEREQVFNRYIMIPNYNQTLRYLVFELFKII